MDVGIVTASVHNMISTTVAKFCKVHKAPNMGAILNKKCYLFNDRLEVEKVSKFIASLLPDNLLFPVSLHIFKVASHV